MNSSPSLPLCFETAVRSRHENQPLLPFGAADNQCCAGPTPHYDDLIQLLSRLSRSSANNSVTLEPSQFQGACIILVILNYENSRIPG